MSRSPPILLWFRQDLRAGDHPALSAAVATGAPIIPLYILDDETPGVWKMGGASRWWLHGSLDALDAKLRALGSRLILRCGTAREVLKHIATEVSAQGIYFTRGYSPHDAADENAIAADFKNMGVECRRFGGNLLFEPEAVRTKTGTPFKVFTPFYRACLTQGTAHETLNVPKAIPSPQAWPTSDLLKRWSLRPANPDWAGGLKEHWQPGSDGAKDRLETFLTERATTYPSDRDRPDREGTSALSPHLHFGEISPRQIWRQTMKASAESGTGDSGRTAFLREIIWREFSHHLLHHWPQISEAPFNATFKRFPWRSDEQSLDAWQRGTTGYPIVDAGMRQLWHTGWMHNRVRMIAASFLTKHLLIHWQEGARWFWDTLVDADLANNSASWQWVAGSGADAAPYFRVFNPILQGTKFDPDGDYVRRWVPELSNFSGRNIHAPWESSGGSSNYPAPIVDHKAARQRALLAYDEIRKK